MVCNSNTLPEVDLPKSPNFKKETPNFKSKLKQIALDILKASLLSISLAATAYPFVGRANVPLLKILTISTVASAVIVKQLVSLKDSYFDAIEKNPIRDSFLSKLRANYGREILSHYPHFVLSLLDVTTRLTLIHEMGHAIIGKLVYANANPSIQIIPLTGGVAKLKSNQLSEIGNKFGDEKAYLLFAAAGPTFAMLFNLADLTLAHAVKKSAPDLNKFLITSVFVNTFISAKYALQALSNPPKGHDFIPIWKTGKVHPLVAAAITIAIPSIYQFFLTTLFPSKKQDSENTVSR